MKNCPVYQAVLPLLAYAQNQASDSIIKEINEIRALIKLHKNNFKMIAPSATTVWDSDYKQKKEFQNFIRNITKTVSKDIISGIRMVEIDEEQVLRYIDSAKEEAKAPFELYVAKLVNKIGVVVSSAELSGTPWSYSFITVETETGKQVWKTQMILNFSKYGKMFNQFPTKKVS